MATVQVNAKIKARTIKIIKEVMINEDLEIILSADLVHDIGMDSLETAEMIFAIEDMFNIDISDDEFEAFEKSMTLKQVIDLIEAKF